MSDLKMMIGEGVNDDAAEQLVKAAEDYLIGLAVTAGNRFLSGDVMREADGRKVLISTYWYDVSDCLREDEIPSYRAFIAATEQLLLDGSFVIKVFERRKHVRGS